jgi:D-alanyl-D-alanine carboxypeptidase
MKQRLIFLVVVLCIVGVGVVVFRHHNSNVASSTTAKTSSTNSSSTSKNPTTFDKTEHSLTDPKSVWVVVNKKRPLQPQDYIPADLVTPSLPLRVPGNESMQMRKVTADNLSDLFAAAKTADNPLMVSSGYRSYSYQVSLYGKYVTDQGKAVADTQSARPGYSEHQTGLAVDVEPIDQKCDVDQCFADLPAGKWLAANAYKYGFIIRYPKDKTAVTGYEYEPWHIRYVGVDLATEMHNQNVETMEEFFGTGAAPDY